MPHVADDSSEAIQDFLDSGNDTRPSEYITNIALSDAERDISGYHRYQLCAALLVHMTKVVNHKALHEFVLQKCKEQTMAFTKKLKLRGNSPQINKLRRELTTLVNKGGDNSDRILRLEEQIQLLVDEDLAQALQNRKNFRILEDERPSKSFLNLENAKRWYNEVMLVKKDNPEFNPIMTGGGHYVPAEFSRLFFSNFLLNTMVRYFLTFHIYV